MTAGEKIGIIAKERKISLRQISVDAGIPYNTLYSIVSRKSNRINNNALLKIASALGISVFELMDPEKCPDDFKKGVSEPIDIQNPDIQKAFRRYIKDGKLEFPGLAEGSALDAENRENELLYHFRNLNERGQQVAVERVEELTKIPEYQNDKNN